MTRARCVNVIALGALAAALGCADGAKSRTVTITRVRTLVAPDGTRASTAQPVDGLSVLVADGDGYRRITGAVSGSTLTIPGVPAGPYLVDLSALYGGGAPVLQAFEGDAAKLESVALAPAGAVPLGSPAHLTLDLQGLEGLYGESVFAFAPAVGWADGAWPGSATTVDFGLPASQYALDAARGDVLYGWNLVPGAVAGRTARAAHRFGRLADLSWIPGQDAQATLTLAEGAPGSGSEPLDWRGSEFAAAVATAGQPILADGATVAYAPMAGPAVGPSVLELDLPVSDLDVGSVAYGLPAAGWSAQRETAVWGVLDGLGESLVPVTTVLVDQVDGAGRGPVRLRVGPPRRLAVGGHVLNRQLVSGVGTTPVVTWDAPATGTPDGYDLVLRPASYAGSTVLWVRDLRARAFRIPPGLLQPGVPYWVRVIAKVTAADGCASATAHGWRFTP